METVFVDLLVYRTRLFHDSQVNHTTFNWKYGSTILFAHDEQILLLECCQTFFWLFSELFLTCLTVFGLFGIDFGSSLFLFRCHCRRHIWFHYNHYRCLRCHRRRRKEIGNPLLIQVAVICRTGGSIESLQTQLIPIEQAWR